MLARSGTARTEVNHDASVSPLAFGGKHWTSFFRDGVGDGPRLAVKAPLLLTVDTVPGDTSTTATLTVDGDHIISTLDMIGDQDFYAVQLVAGQTYDISMFLTTGGPSGVPLADAYIELYDAAGTLIVSADGGGPNTPAGLDAILTFTAQSSGTYYVNARAYDQDSTNGSTGDHVGDYELFVNTVDTSAPGAYVPFYSPDSPLHSLDWGSQFTRTVRNPDGDNGTRDNGVENTGTVVNPTYGVTGKNVITYYFAEQGDVFLSEDPANPGLETTLQARNLEQWEKDAFVSAFDLYEQVADLQYVRVNSRAEADIKIIVYQGTPGAGASLLGRMSPPGEQNEGQMEINGGDYRWTEEGVSPGGFYFPTLMHELGHGHGMSHPHDNGGRSSVMRGAGPSDDPVEGAIGGQYGDFGLSQQVYTIMSYNDGWNDTDGVGGRPDGHGGPRSGGLQMQADHFGWMGSLAALDIAVLQDKYGVNEAWATGDDVYTIGDVNGPGNFYSTIWDGGGNDEIRYVGSRDAVIDLRAATLKYEEGGGGRVSFAMGAWTGLTIANGVVIERATGGSGNDVLTGNDADNILAGGAGVDILIGGLGRDTVDYSQAASSVRAQLNTNASSNDGDGGTDTFSGIENLTGSAFDDLLIGDGGANVLHGGAGRDTLLGLAGDDILIGGDGAGNQMQGGRGDDRYIVTANDTLVEFLDEGIDTVETTLSAYALRDNFENLIYTGPGNFTGTGNALANTITGGAGNDVLTGGKGDDFLIGGAGEDVAVMSGARADYTVAAGASPDQYTITDSVGGRDGIDSLSGVERVRFSDGSTVLLSELVAPSGAAAMSAKYAGEPQVLPGFSDDDFLIGKGDDTAWVTPLVEEDTLGLDETFQPMFSDVNTMLTLFQNDDYMMPAAQEFGRDIDMHHNWM
jgi:serralysin